MVKVRTPREPKAPSNEPQRVKGSTRLEAKKQRRRDGRDAGRRRSVITESEFLARREAVDRTMVVRSKDGKIQLGANGAAGEIAHQIIKFDGPICGCGARGCAEPLTNSAAIATLAGTKTAEEAYKKALLGDEKALAAFKEVAYWIAITLTNIMVVLVPDTIIIGGGVAQSGDILLKEIRIAMQERAHLYPVSDINVVPATLGFYAGSIGAALYGAITAGAQLSLISTT